MSLIALIMNQLIHQHFMKMSEIFINKCIFINDYGTKLIKIYNRSMYDSEHIFNA